MEEKIRLLVRIIFVILLTLSICSGKVTAQSGHVPVIVNNNPKYIDLYVNPVTLNWSVTDDNLIFHKIFQGNNLIDEKNYTISEETTINILLQFTLGKGSYNFTLQVGDQDGNLILDTIHIVKGKDVEDSLVALNDFAGSSSFVTIAILGLLVLSKIRIYANRNIE